MAKRMKFERSGARKRAQGVDLANLTPPTPQETAAMVADGIPVLRGSSDQLGLSPAGIEEAKDTGAKLAAKGGLTDLKSSGAKRAQQTAELVGAEQPNPIPLQQDGDMDSFAIGNAEGQPRALVGQQIKDLVRNNPSYKIPACGAVAKITLAPEIEKLTFNV